MTGKSEKGRRKCRDKAVRAPQPFSGIINQVCHKDRKYFEEHPDITHFLRRYVPGEFWPFIFPYDAWVEVRQIQSGIRMRSAVFYDMRVVEEVRPQ